MQQGKFTIHLLTRLLCLLLVATLALSSVPSFLLTAEITRMAEEETSETGAEESAEPKVLAASSPGVTRVRVCTVARVARLSTLVSPRARRPASSQFTPAFPTSSRPLRC